MEQIKKEDIKQEVFDLYDDYAHNRVSRRDFMQNNCVDAIEGSHQQEPVSYLALRARFRHNAHHDGRGGGDGNGCSHKGGDGRNIKPHQEQQHGKKNLRQLPAGWCRQAMDWP